MSDDSNDATGSTDGGDPDEATPGTSNYKVLGELDEDGVGVLGRNTADTGAAVGVRGVVPNDPTGYGLATPDAARVEGDLEATSGHVLTVDGDRALRLGPTGTDYLGDIGGGSVVGGHPSNAATDAVGGTIGGGGADGSPNRVTDDYGTVAGGLDNRAGDAMSGTDNAIGATVGGGENNAAVASHATVAGGFDNAASGFEAFVGGGDDNAASGEEAVVGGGLDNLASGDGSVVGGGANNEAFGEDDAIGGGAFNRTGKSGLSELYRATVGGGYFNVAEGKYATIAGGSDNRTGSSGTTDTLYATVGGGQNNRAIEKFSAVAGGRANGARGTSATVAGGRDNDAYGDHDAIGGGQDNRTGTSGGSGGLWATVPGGQNNVAEGTHSFAAGEGAEALHDGAFVWSDSTSGTTTSTTGNTFTVQATNGVGVNTTSPDATLDVNGGNADLSATEGDLKVGTDANRLKIGVAVAGGGAGIANVRTEGTNVNKLNLGAGTSTILSIEEVSNGTAVNSVYPASDGTYSLGKGDKKWTAVYADDGTIQTSDARLKTDVAELEDGLDLVSELRPVSYDWKDGGPSGETTGSHDGDPDEESGRGDGDSRLGLIAQEVAEVVPEAVVDLDGDGDGDGYLGLNYETLVPVLIAAVQDQQATIETLRSEAERDRERIDALEADNDRLGEENERLRERLSAVETAVGMGSGASSDD